MANERHLELYRAWLLKQPCACQPCVSPVVIHHSTVGSTAQHAKSIPGRRGKGQRASDDEGIAICNRHHANFHDLRGYFEGWEKQQLRDWQNAQVERLTRLFGMAYPDPIASATATSSPAKRKRIGSGWTVAGVRDWCRREARFRPAAAADALTELANLLEADTL
jgi:hypothetical protein